MLVLFLHSFGYLTLCSKWNAYLMLLRDQRLPVSVLGHQEHGVIFELPYERGREL